LLNISFCFRFFSLSSINLCQRILTRHSISGGYKGVLRFPSSIVRGHPVLSEACGAVVHMPLLIQNRGRGAGGLMPPLKFEIVKNYKQLPECLK
jgi:hypothetical protein